MSKKSPFRTDISAPSKPSDPESLFQDLKRRDPSVKHLWAHQADLLRSYQKKSQSSRDLALELPTGSGKTLVGLLIGEYRRQTFDERVIYVCPTRQLVNQVVSEATNKYNLPAVALMPPEYEGINQYRRGSHIGVCTYSAVFNTNPRIDDPQCIILDDAHAGEQFISDLWSLSINQEKYPNLYKSILGYFCDQFEPAVLQTFMGRDVIDINRAFCTMIPPHIVWRNIQAIRELIDENISKKNDEIFPWRMIRNNLHACCFYVSRDELLIRPIIPPTCLHDAFSGAKQRVYMSATLGRGGELERITGVKNIERLSMPEGWAKKSTGRRLFLFPDMSLSEADAQTVSIKSSIKRNKVLVLTPRQADATRIRENYRSRSFPTFEATDIEKTLKPYVDSAKGALILANRYDGIDLPDEICRLIVFSGLPSGVNLQERFIIKQLRANAVLRDRLRTRFTQGVGRCCRNETDYAAVIVTGQGLLDFCARSDVRSTMHPELQAELEFGLKNSEDQDESGLNELLDAFYDDNDAWGAAESAIQNYRNKAEQISDTVVERMSAAAPHEVDYIYEIWRKNFQGAVEAASKAADNLGGEDAAGYRAWWMYLAGFSAFAGSSELGGEELGRAADRYFGNAMKAARHITWFNVGDIGKGAVRKKDAYDFLNSCAVEGALDRIHDLGLQGTKFEKEMAKVDQLISSSDATEFERGLEALGKLLGFSAFRPDKSKDGVPDGVWKLKDNFAIVWEAKSAEKGHKSIPIGVVRQASTQEQWARDNAKLSSDAEVRVIVLSLKGRIESQARRSAGNLLHMSVDTLRDISTRAIDAARHGRSSLGQDVDRFSLNSMHSSWATRSVLPSDIMGATKRLEALPEASEEEKN